MARKMTLSEYVKHWNELSEDFPKFAKRFLLKEAIQVKNEAVDNGNHQDITGALRASWKVSKVVKTGNNYSVKISNSMNYASFLEYGTKRGIKARYMITRPINEYHRTLYKRFKAEWDAYRKEKGLD